MDYKPPYALHGYDLDFVAATNNGNMVTAATIRH